MAQCVGTVAWFNNAKGFGSLTREGSPDVFIHYSAIQMEGYHMEGYHTLKENAAVEFDVIQGNKGPQADKVTIVGKL
jgi:CspA family cold shock protein